MGFIYILSNNAMPGYIKIGFTNETVKARATSLFETSVPEPFIIEDHIETVDASKIEKKIHTLLNDYRHRPNREFFKLSVLRAKELISEYFPELQWKGTIHYDPKEKISTEEKLRLKYEELQEKGNNFFEFMENNEYFESPYDGSNKLKCDILKNRVDIIHKSLDSRKKLIESEKKRNELKKQNNTDTLLLEESSALKYLNVDDSWSLKEMKSIGRDIDNMYIKAQSLAPI